MLTHRYRASQPLAHSRTKFTRPGAGSAGDTHARHTVASPPLPSPSRTPPLTPPQLPPPRPAALATAAAAATAVARRPPPAGDSNKAAPRGCTSETRPLRKDASDKIVEDHGEVREGGQHGQLGRDGGCGVRMRSPSRRGPAQLVSCCVRTSARSAAHPPKASGGACWLTCEAVRDARRRGYRLAGNDDEGAAAEAHAQRDRPLESSSSACGACGGARRSKGEFERHSDYPRY